MMVPMPCVRSTSSRNVSVPLTVDPLAIRTIRARGAVLGA
jgi:hypothetical protein